MIVGPTFRNISGLFVVVGVCFVRVIQWTCRTSSQPKPSLRHFNDNETALDSARSRNYYNRSNTQMVPCNGTQTLPPIPYQQQLEPQHLYNFALNPDTASQELLDCLYEQVCSVLYFHFAKTGGTDVEQRFFEAFPPTLPSTSYKAHRTPLVTYFLKHQDQYCTAKFSSYEVSAQAFLRTIVPTCLEFKQKQQLLLQRPHHKQLQERTVVILATMREPIARTISSIHQLCNKNWDRRDDATQQACQACSYQEHSKFWDDYFFGGNTSLHATVSYQQLQSVVYSNLPNTSVVLVDTMDLEELYRTINHRVAVAAQNNHTRTMVVDKIPVQRPVQLLSLQDSKHNKELVQRCNFALTSDLIRTLSIPLQIYRNLTLSGTRHYFE